MVYTLELLCRVSRYPDFDSAGGSNPLWDHYLNEEPKFSFFDPSTMGSFSK